jgi:hypothetical protein
VEKQQIYLILRGFFERGTRKAKKTGYSDVQNLKTAGRVRKNGFWFRFEFQESRFDPIQSF